MLSLALPYHIVTINKGFSIKPLLFILLLFFSSSLLAMNEVSLQLKWKYQFQFAGFIMAKEKGFYKDLGLDVSLIEFNSSIDTLSDILNDKTDFAIGDASLVQSSMQGDKVLAIMAILQESPYTLLALKSSNINSLEDMNGKKIALYEDINGVSLKAMLKSRNIIYDTRPMGTNHNQFINKEVDVMAAYLSNEPYLMQELGLDIISFNPKYYGFKSYGDILYSSKDTLKNRPELVQKMHQASKKGWEYAFSHIDETVDLIYKKYNTLHKSKESLHYEAQSLKKLSGYGTNFGELNKDKLQSISHLYSYMLTEKHNEHWLDSFIYTQQIDKSINNMLTLDEQKYLKSKKEIKVCIQPELYPLDAFIDKKHTGLMSDIYTTFEDTLHIKFKYINSKTHSDLDVLAASGKCDLISIIAKNQKRFPNFSPTISLIESNFTVISKNDKAFLKNIDDFTHKKFAVRTNAYKSYILHFHPNMQIEVITDGIQRKKSLLNDKIYGLLEINFLADITINDIGYEYVKLNGFLLPQNPIQGSIGVKKSEIILKNILNKNLQKMQSGTLKKIENKWRMTRYTKEVDHTLLIQVSILFFIVLLLGLIWTIIIHNKNKALKIAKDKILYLNDTLEQRVKIEVKKNEEQQLLMLQQSRLAQMGEIINMIAHQWKQPLNNLSLLTQTVIMKYKKSKLDDISMQSFKENSQKQILDMSNVINDFKNFFQPQKDKVIYEVSSSIYQALDILKPILDEANITIELNTSEQLIKGYPNEIAQTFINIINNAKDALLEKNNQERKIKISIEVIQKDIVICIEDNAGGIPKDIIDKIFNPYFSTKNEKNGTGLGLYMVKLIIEDHMDGSISVLNTGSGTLFSIKFPKVNLS